MKKTLLMVFIFVIVFLIYYFNADRKIYYLSIGDYLSYGMNNFEKKDKGYSDFIKDKYKSNIRKHVNYSTYDDYRVMDLINDIKYNNSITYDDKEYKIQNLLIKANLITFSIGMNDLIYKKNINYDYVDQLLKDIEELFKLMRKYNKDKIYFLGFYNIINNQELIEYTNKRLINICKDYKIEYVDISDLNNYIISGIYPTEEGYKYIADRILNFTK